MRQKGTCAVAPPKDSFLLYALPHKAMSNCNFVKRQLKFDKPMYLFTKTNKLKTKTKKCFTTKTMHYLYF